MIDRPLAKDRPPRRQIARFDKSRRNGRGPSVDDGNAELIRNRRNFNIVAMRRREKQQIVRVMAANPDPDEEQPREQREKSDQ